MPILQTVGDILRGALEIGILWTFYYWILVYFQGSVAIQVLRGVVVLAVVYLVARLLHLEVFIWLFTKVVTVVAIAFIVVFHPELRRGLARIGGETIFRSTPRHEKVVEEILKGVYALSRRRIGSIIAVERHTSMQSYAEGGVRMDAVVSSELLQTIFMPNTPLHDGGVIVSQGRLIAAACFFPLSQNPRLAKSMGTRHRAALGISEEMDAIVIVVSEETGAVSVATNGELVPEVTREQLAQILFNVSGKGKPL